jgi:hypothetical protein
MTQQAVHAAPGRTAVATGIRTPLQIAGWITKQSVRLPQELQLRAAIRSLDPGVETH